jgi:hypothetical protein
MAHLFVRCAVTVFIGFFVVALVIGLLDYSCSVVRKDFESRRYL